MPDESQIRHASQIQAMASMPDPSIAPQHPDDARLAAPRAADGSPGTPGDMRQQCIELQAQCERLRQALAAEIQARKSEQAVAAKSVRQAQDLNAALFRLRQLLSATELDAQEHEGRCVELDAEVRELSERREEDLKQIQELHAQRGQAMEIDHWRAYSMQVTSLLASLLSSRSWSLTRPLRWLAERARGRAWREPQIPPPPATSLSCGDRANGPDETAESPNTAPAPPGA
jgi:hypothetical protein